MPFFISNGLLNIQYFDQHLLEPSILKYMPSIADNFPKLSSSLKVGSTATPSATCTHSCHTGYIYTFICLRKEWFKTAWDRLKYLEQVEQLLSITDLQMQMVY